MPPTFIGNPYSNGEVVVDSDGIDEDDWDDLMDHYALGQIPQPVMSGDSADEEDVSVANDEDDEDYDYDEDVEFVDDDDDDNLYEMFQGAILPYENDHDFFDIESLPSPVTPPPGYFDNLYDLERTSLDSFDDDDDEVEDDDEDDSDPDWELRTCLPNRGNNIFNVKSPESADGPRHEPEIDSEVQKPSSETASSSSGSVSETVEKVGSDST